MKETNHNAYTEMVDNIASMKAAVTDQRNYLVEERESLQRQLNIVNDAIAVADDFLNDDVKVNDTVFRG